MGDLLEVGQVAVQQGRADGQEVGVARVVDLNDTPRVLAGAHLATPDLDDVLRADNGERHQAPELGVLLNRVLVVLLDIVGEVVNRNAVVLDVLHHQLLGLGQLRGRERVGAADDRDDVDAGREALHQLDVELAEAGGRVSLISMPSLGPGLGYIPMAGRGDKVEHGVHTIVSEAGVTLDTRFLGKNVIVLPLQVADDL